MTEHVRARDIAAKKPEREQMLQQLARCKQGHDTRHYYGWLSDIDYLLSLLDAPPIVDAEQVAREIVDNELDEMMSPREYSATRRALIDRIAAALTAQRVAPSENDEAFAQQLYDALAVNDDINTWHKDTLLPMIATIAAAYGQAQRVAERQRIREAVENLLQHCPAGLGWTLIDVLRAIDGGEADG